MSVLSVMKEAAEDTVSADIGLRLLRAAEDVAELIVAAKKASATLGHAYHTTLTGQLAEYAHADYQRLDAALARVTGGQP